MGAGWGNFPNAAGVHAVRIRVQRMSAGHDVHVAVAACGALSLSVVLRRDNRGAEPLHICTACLTALTVARQLPEVSCAAA